MSNQTIVENTGSQAHIQTDVSKIFVWEPKDQSADYTNTSGSDVDLKAGRLMGRISATGLFLPHLSTAVDGSQFPVGILMHDITVANGATASLTVCVSGHVVRDKVIYGAGEDENTVLDDRQLQDRIASDTVGIYLVDSDELTDFDNA